MKAVLIGYAMLIGGPAIATLNILEWLRWRAGRPPLLGGTKSAEFLDRDPKSGMGKIIESMELVGWTVMGLFIGFVGFVIVSGI